jgi:hypothetical protein
VKYILIVIADWIDDNILRHRFYSVCKKIGFSSWWEAKNSITFPKGTIIKTKLPIVLRGNIIVKGG